MQETTTVRVNKDNDLKFRQGLLDQSTNDPKEEVNYNSEEVKRLYGEKTKYSSAYGEMRNTGNETGNQLEYFTE